MADLRVCSWNIQLGRRLDLIEEVLQTLAESGGLDVVAVQEASVHSGVEDAAVIARHLGSSYRHHQVTAQHFRGEPQANALIWDSRRLSARHRGHFELPSLTEPAGLSHAERWLLARVRKQRRCAVFLEAQLTAGETIRVYSVHADVLGFAHRRRQLAAVLAHNAGAQVAMALIAGDLNTFGVASVPSWQTLHRGAKEAGFIDLTSAVRWTHEIRRIGVRQKLDFVFATNRAHLTHHARSVASRASDHRPQFVELSWDDR